MPRQPGLDTGPQRCLYAERPDQRPHCQLTAVVSYGTAALCADCQARRSTLGKAHRARPLPPRGEIDVIEWITQTEQNLRNTHTELAAAVHRARAQGRSWTTIGAALHTTRQAAQQRFTKDQHPKA